MLTSDLVRGRKHGEKLLPRFLDPKARPRLTELARAYVATYSRMVGESRATLDAALDAVPVGARDRLLALGLRKLCEDRAEFDVEGEIEPERVRDEIFLRAAAAHRAVERGTPFDRAAVMAASATALEVSVETLERTMFADLRLAHELRAFDPIPAEELLDRYDLSVVQALLLRASKVTLRFQNDDPPLVRKLFRKARFLGLLHSVSRRDNAYEVVFDGPISLFGPTQRYGLKLAMFLPSVLELMQFTLTAEIAHGPERERLTMTIDQATGLRPPAASAEARRPEIDALVTAFRELESDWKVDDCDRLISLPGEAICAPDLVFSNQKTGEEVLFELFGFWSRAAVFQRIDLVKKGTGGRMILAVGKHLRVSQELLDEDDGGEIYLFKSTLSAKEILLRLDRGRPAKVRPGT